VRRPLLFVLLLLSLAVNAGVLFALGRSLHARWRIDHELDRMLTDGARGRAEWMRSLKTFILRRDSLRCGYWEWRRELGRLALAAAPDPVRVETALDSMADCERRMDSLGFVVSRDLFLLRRPELRERERERWLAGKDWEHFGGDTTGPGTGGGE